MANVNVILAGRMDVNDYFEQSGVFESERLNHTPFLVFLIEEDAVTVRVVEKSSELLTYPDNTPVMAQRLLPIYSRPVSAIHRIEEPVAQGSKERDEDRRAARRISSVIV